MTWIQLHAGAYSNPKITRAARELTGSDVEKMVGHLARLWTWSVDFAESGDLSHLRPVAIANAAGWTESPRRFLNVLLDVGLFDSGPKLHDWDEYSGRLVDRRKQDRARKKAARLAETLKSSAGTSAGRPLDVQTVDDSDSDNRVEDDVVVVADAVEDDGVEANVSRALAALGRVRWYPVSESEDRPILHDAAARVSGQDLAADVRRFAERAAKNGTPRRPRAALMAWLAKFGDLDRPANRDEHIPLLDELLAEKQWTKLKSDDQRRAAAWRVLLDVRQGAPFRSVDQIPQAG